MNLLVGADNEAVLKWLDAALEYAFKHKEVKLWPYLEVVMDEVLFEMELETRS